MIVGWFSARRSTIAEPIGRCAVSDRESNEPTHVGRRLDGAKGTSKPNRSDAQVHVAPRDLAIELVKTMLESSRLPSGSRIIVTTEHAEGALKELCLERCYTCPRWRSIASEFSRLTGGRKYSWLVIDGRRVRRRIYDLDAAALNMSNLS